jgi:hypothetical protein
MRVSVRQLFVILLFIGLFIMTVRPIADPDFWWHLRTGELISQTHTIPHTDPFSFTNIGKNWIAHEWLSELFFYGIYKLAGFPALIILFAFVISSAFFFCYLRFPPTSRPYVAGFILLLGAMATAPTWGVRPQMISLLLTSAVLLLLDRYRSENRLKYLIPLPLITLVWVNLHAGYFLGLAIIGIYIVGGLIEIFIVEIFNKNGSTRPTLKSLIVLFVVLGTCVLAALVNPNGIKIITYPFQTLVSPSMQQLIQEWFSPDFHLIQWQPLAWIFLLLIAVGMVGKKSLSVTKILLVVILGYAALHSMRNVPLFVIVAIPILAELVDSIVKIPSKSQMPSRLFKWIAPVLIVFALLATSLRVVQVINNQADTEGAAFPKSAVDWIQLNNPPSNIFNSYGWGGYLIWRLYPTYNVFIDGRADVYGDDFIFEFIDLQNADAGWETRFNNMQINTVLIEPDVPLAKVLLLSPNWKISFQDKASIIFVRQ